MRLTARDYDNIAEEQEAMIQQEIKKIGTPLMLAKDLNDSHIGGVYRLFDGVVVLQDVIQGEKQILLQTDKGSIVVGLETPIETVA